jgi:hypothetical protein
MREYWRYIAGEILRAVVVIVLTCLAVGNMTSHSWELLALTVALCVAAVPGVVLLDIAINGIPR